MVSISDSTGIKAVVQRKRFQMRQKICKFAKISLTNKSVIHLVSFIRNVYKQKDFEPDKILKEN